MSLKRFSIPIVKRNDEQQMVWGYASTPARDYDGDIITLDAMKGALPEYMKFANIREMHGMVAVGVAKEAEVDERGLYIGAKIVDPLAWLKVKEGVYKAFSIGGNATDRDKADAHTITGLQLIEISIVDRPANPEAIIDVFKASAPKESAMATATPQEDTARAELLAAVNALSGDALHSALDAFRKAAGVKDEPQPEPVSMTKVAAPAAPVQPPEPPAKRIARCLKAAGSQSVLVRSVAKAVGFTDAQFENTMKLDQMALANWLGNNHGLLDNIQKAIPDDSQLWSGQKPVAMAAVAEAEDDTADIAKAVGDFGTHEDAGYADTGFQADNKPRFPLKKGGKWSEQRIRAAYDFVSKAKNVAAYSEDQIKIIDKNITSAWVDHIDKRGPSAAGTDKAHNPKPKLEKNVTTIIQTPDAKGDLRKGLMTACLALGLLNRLDGLQKSIAAEEIREGDKSESPSRFAALLKTMASAVQAYVDEEVQEMLSGESDNYDVGMPYPDYVCYGDKAQDLLKQLGFNFKVVSEGLEKSIGDRTGAAGFANLSKFATDTLAKNASPAGESADWTGDPSSAVQPQDWKAKAQTMHDISKTMGATCKAMDEEKDDGKDDKKKKKSPAADTAKAKKDEPPAKDGDDEDSEDNAEDEDADAGEKDPKEPSKKKKKAATGTDKGADNSGLDALKGILSEVIAASPLAKAVEELTTNFAAISKNPPLPAKAAAPAARAVAKTADAPADDKPAAADKVATPADVLKGILARPNIARN